ncbi:MAG: glycosyltransferase family 1 protein [Candidatus Microgenomates bacterium]
MRIGLNILYLIPGGVGGTETYARHLISALIKQLKSEDELIIYATRETAPTFTETKQLRVVTLPIYARNRVLRLLAEQILLPFYLLHDHIDVIFSLGYSSPILHPCPAVVTIHDLNWYYHPEDFGGIEKLVWQILTTTSAKTSNHIISISHATTDSLMRVLHIPDTKITTILHGSPEKKMVKEGKSIIELPYLFTVLAGYPHKNLITLLQAFKEITKTNNELVLVVCGLSGRADSKSQKYIRDNGLENKVKILGYVDDNTLCNLYQNASIFVFPSAYEGFGIPVLEAMSYGVPVVSSNAFSLAEVVGNGGILVDPYNVAAYIGAVSKILKDSILRKDLIKRGQKRASELKWEKTATITLKIIKKEIPND